MATSKPKANKERETIDYRVAVGIHLLQAQEILQTVSRHRGEDQTLLAASDLLDMVAHAITQNDSKLPAALKDAANTVARASGYNGLRQNDPKNKAVVAGVMVENLMNEIRLHGSPHCFPGRPIEECCAVLIAESLVCAGGDRIMLNREKLSIQGRISRWTNEARSILKRADTVTDNGRRAAAVRIVKRCTIVDGMTTKGADALFARAAPLPKVGRVRRNPTD